MTLNQTREIKAGSILIYNDGRKGHTNALAHVLQIDGTGMTVQFVDRADTTRIRLSDRAWMDYLTVAGKQSLTWEYTPNTHGNPFWTAQRDGTRYWVVQHILHGYWFVEDNHGAVWGEFETAEGAKLACEHN